MKSLFLSLLLGLGLSNALASNPIKKIMEANPNLSPFEVLAKFYESAGPAHYNDFDQATFSADGDQYLGHLSYQCAAVADSHKDDLQIGYSPFVWEMVIEPSKPDMGPLFPGTPPKIQKVIAFAESLPTQSYDYSNYTVLGSSTATDLVQEFVSKDETVGYRLKTFFRLREGLLVMLNIIEAKKPPLKDIEYGYCWKK